MSKKITVFISVVLIVFLVLFLGMLISGKTSEEDKEYINNLLNANIRPGQSYDEIKIYFNGLGTEVDLWECAEKMKNDTCLGEAAFVTTVPLSSNNVFLGKGEAQIYLYFNSGKVLESFDYELFYSKNH